LAHGHEKDPLSLRVTVQVGHQAVNQLDIGKREGDLAHHGRQDGHAQVRDIAFGQLQVAGRDGGVVQSHAHLLGAAVHLEQFLQASPQRMTLLASGRPDGTLALIVVQKAAFQRVAAEIHSDGRRF